MGNFHLSVYSASLGLVTDSDVTAALDEILTRRNSHLIFTEPYELLAAYGTGTTLTRARFGNASLNQIGNPHIWPLERLATIGDNPVFMDFRNQPLVLPQNEELTILATTDAAGPARVEIPLWIGASQWNRNIPGYRDRLRTRATAVVAAGAEGAWTALSELVFERDLINGVYSVIGANVVAANAVAFRLQFPDQRPVNGRQHRPGSLVQNALGDEPCKLCFGEMGEWGRFHTFTPPALQVFGDAAGGTYEVRLDLLYLGTSESALMSY